MMTSWPPVPPEQKSKFSALREILEEYDRARQLHPGGMHSAHEGFAVLKEEVDELWDEVKRNATKERMAQEAVQIGAMALAFLVEVCGVKE